ncbi:hypothetical protein SRS16CHR_04988 [Variovorax sp. SRS16]|uniref:hypothetical protein n=1 Tax=Variovorax sp. SRS16 TaxID=282217 RepID=UPI00131923BA|nr:hypothetical protein [Variovorax sp. SRS16]VTU31950.1 hypothetical protein SRS16CHR_04988 [Variovorax sp. SRS16]
MSGTRYVRSASRVLPGTEAQQKRDAWMGAIRVRRAVQARIVQAFRRQLDGAGPGPLDEDLLMFAKLAVAEQRLMRRAG